MFIKSKISPFTRTERAQNNHESNSEIQVGNREILLIDYSDLKQDQMIELGDLVLAQVLDDNTHFRI